MKHIFFDLDGTLLSIDGDAFMKAYFEDLTAVAAREGYDGGAVAKAVFRTTFDMKGNDGSKTNEDVFWDAFLRYTAIEKHRLIESFSRYYETDYRRISKVASPFEGAVDALRRLKSKGYKLYLTTQPFFPRIAIDVRAEWAGLDLSMFEWVTTYECARFSKPNPAYYHGVMQRFGLKPEDVLMVGNDVEEDGAIARLGVECLFVKEELINLRNLPIRFPLVTHRELYDRLDALPVVAK